MNRENETHYNQSSMNIDMERKYLPFNPEQVIIEINDMNVCLNVSINLVGTMFVRSTSAEGRLREIGHILV